MLSGATEMKADLAALQGYPESLPDARASCLDTGFNDSSIWLTSLWFSNGDDDELKQTGIIPSPQLVDLLGLRTIAQTFDFSSAAGEVTTMNAPGYEKGLLLCRRSILENALWEHRLSLFWRVYCWKWVPSADTGKYPSREYWAMFQHRKSKVPEFVDGGSHLLGPCPEETKPLW